MKKSVAIIIFVLCITMLLSAGCTGSGTTSTPPVSAPALSDGSSGGTGQVFSCSIGVPADVSKSGVLQITSAQAEVVTKNVIMISGKIRNNAGEGTSSGVAAKLCNSRTGNCVNDMVGEIFKPYETVDYSLIPLGGCPDTGSDVTSCTCEVWIDILR